MSKSFKAIALVPMDRAFTEVQIDSYKEIISHVGFPTDEDKYFECVSVTINGEKLTVFIDGEGRLKGHSDDIGYWFQLRTDHGDIELVGNALIAGGADWEGETTDCEVSIEELANVTGFAYAKGDR